ncbi:MAG: lysozyme family protein [Lachnospiraceae bacterium]|nr:lysozyme family protein [Lachnospiraceae bacterium]
MEENRERREEREFTRREKQRKQERLRREQELRIKIAALSVLVLFVLLSMIRGIVRWRESVREEEERKKQQELEERENELLSESVLQYRDLVEYYAAEEGIEHYVPVLLAIMQVETAGERDDVMQSSESAGLEPNSLGPEDSIAQACDYFRGLVDRQETTGVDDRTVIQAYNYGPGYIYYIEENGGVHSFDLAVAYAEEMSGGRTANYTHPIADDNGNWMYLYGNMYYVKLVEQYLP